MSPYKAVRQFCLPTKTLQIRNEMDPPGSPHFPGGSVNFESSAVPITWKSDFESGTLFVEAYGLMTWEDRRAALAGFRESFASGKIKYALFDLRNLTADNDPKDEVEFGKMMVEAIGAFHDIRAAVVLSEAFRVSSSVVLRLQQSGFNMLDFLDVVEARAWLYNGERPGNRTLGSFRTPL